MGNLFLYVELNFSTHMQLQALFGLGHVDSALVGHRIMTTNKKSNCEHGKLVFVHGHKMKYNQKLNTVNH